MPATITMLLATVGVVATCLILAALLLRVPTVKR